jgi:hypothetical protein
VERVAGPEDTAACTGSFDGQIREIEERFEIEGMQAMRPLGRSLQGDGRSLRCIARERARWAVEAEKKRPAGNRTKWTASAASSRHTSHTNQWLEAYKRENGT